jgi:hypothetical protein
MQFLGDIDEARAELDGPLPVCAVLQLGSLRCRVRFTSWRYARMLASVFGTELTADPDSSQPLGADILIAEAPPLPLRREPNRIDVARSDAGYVLVTDPMTCYVDADRRPYRVRIVVHDTAMADAPLAYHFWITTNCWLLLVDRLVLHAAAVRLGDTVLMFSGPKGSGKSTLSLALAASGGVILGEDHLVARRAGLDFLVSGCSGRMRVTPTTQAFFLGERLPPDAVDVPESGKMEFQARHLFASMPYVDWRPERLFFNRIGTRYGVRPLSRKQSLVTLVENTKEMQRFSDRDSYARFLAFLGDFSATVPAFELELADDLADLARLAGRLSCT